MTPMAANFNIVPAALLELPDKNAVNKAQIPTGYPAAYRQCILTLFPDVPVRRDDGWRIDYRF